MPKVTEAHRTARRDEIIGAALRCFAAKGYQRTSMADVIEESGLSAGAIYGYFAGKQELFAAVAGRVLEARQGELEAQRAHGEPLAPGQVMATLIDGMRREPFGHVIVQLWAEAAIDPEIGELVQAVLLRVQGDRAAAARRVGVRRAGPCGRRPRGVGDPGHPGRRRRRAGLHDPARDRAGLRRGGVPRRTPRGAPPLTGAAPRQRAPPAGRVGPQMPCHPGLFAQAWR